MLSRLLAVAYLAALCLVGMPSLGAHERSRLTPSERNGILSVLNQARTAVSLPALDWDPVLEETAQKWAWACTADPSGSGLLAHNPNRSTGYPDSVGENVSGSSIPFSKKDSLNLQSVIGLVTLWTDEGPRYDYDRNTCMGEPYSIHGNWKMCGHYTQVVATATSKVGCGRNVCPNLKHISTLVCDFSPAANVYDTQTGMLYRP